MEGKNCSVLVWGPSASGKTINREAMKQYFGCDHVVDDPSRFELGNMPECSVLVLAPERDLMVHRHGEKPSAFDPDLAYPVATVKGLLGDKWIEPDPDYRAPSKSGVDRFWELLDNYPALRYYWDREKRECDLTLMRRAGYLTSGESVILKCLASIWLRSGQANFRIDVTDLAALDSRSRQPLLEWLADPFWP